jgi:hypothetical protein
MATNWIITKSTGQLVLNTTATALDNGSHRIRIEALAVFRLILDLIWAVLG